MNKAERFQRFCQMMKQGAPQAEEAMKDYQKRVVQRISQPDQPGLVVAHGVGTGKTRSSIEAYKKLKLPTTIVPPAALRQNYVKELNRWVGGVPKNLHISSQQQVARNGIGSYDSPGGLLVVDEAHRARDGGSQLLQALHNSQAKKRLLLTGTPVVNHPRDLATLVNLAANKKLLPESKNDFEQEYINRIKVSPNIFQRFMGLKPGFRYELKNQRNLARILHKYVDYQKAPSEGYPTQSEETIKVPMGEKQNDLYKTILGKAPLWVRWKIKAGLPPGKSELEAMRAFLSGARQASNTNYEFITNKRNMEAAKINKAFGFLQQQVQSNPRFKAVVYSNYLNSGLKPYKMLLDQHHIPYGEFSGDISSSVRNQLVNQYNANKLKALLISSAGAEGLDLKGTRLVQLLEPHFNEEKERQIIGRAVRYKSHAALPPEEQNVLVQRYMAQPRGNFLDRLFGKESIRGTDEYIHDIALQKTMLSKQIMKLLAGS